ncbi:hypothetical protein [Metamycoplasma hominis]|uniref:hypothetical protein n=1 Tax=Metamycoplasma hominis TaxID=2098 RepID=UPI001E35DEF4|nr:hypothetical protein [Metamycoplasma hominis]
MGKKILIKWCFNGNKTQNLRRRNPNQNEALKPKIPYDIYYYYLKKNTLLFSKNTKFYLQKWGNSLENDDAYINLNKENLWLEWLDFTLDI